jgi:hypothetical protein
MQVRALLKPVVDLIGPSYVAATNKRLAAYGLRYDDLYDPLKDEVSSIIDGPAVGEPGILD